MATLCRALRAGGGCAAIAAALVSGACGSLEPPPAGAAAAPAAAPATEAAAPPAAAQRPRRGAGRDARRAPIPERPIDIRADCAFRDETGYRGQLKLVVADSQVQAFEAAVDIPRHGACRFALADFRQVKAGVAPQLTARASDCTVRLWRQASRVTVAFERCEPMCSAGAYPYLWPILADAGKGGCG